MDKHSSQAVLQTYFDDLLMDPAAGEALRQPATMESRSASARPLSDADTELVALEQSKREKLQALLNTKPLVVSAEPALVTPEPPVAEPVREELTLHSEPLQDVEVETAPEVVSVPEDIAAEDEVVAEEEAEEQEETADISQFLQWHENGRPYWAQSRFDALLFDVAGLTLAVPIIALGQIQPLTDELTPLFGQADWFMGMLPTPAGKIRTVNTALFVMPERYDARFLETAKYLVSIDGVPWGLAVDKINQPVSLDPDDVKWRTDRSKRPWLAGTVKSAMCALLDIPQMGQMLMDADKNARPR